METERDKYSMINFEETELRLGLPGGSAINNDGESSLRSGSGGNTGKRGFSETASVDLKLNLSSSSNDLGSASVSASSVAVDRVNNDKTSSNITTTTTPTTPPPRANDPAKPPAKAQVVGWPPVRSYRKNIVSVQNNKKEEEEKTTTSAAAATTTTTTATSSGAAAAASAAAFVKVSVDGAPYLRKVDLKQYKSYKELSDALAKMFGSFGGTTTTATTTATAKCCGSPRGIGVKDFMSDQTKLVDLLNGSDYVPTYEDKDGDWMLVGDVPWEMFVGSCKRLRVVKGSEAIGLAPRAVEKCKNRS